MVAVPKKGDLKVTVELANSAPEDLIIKASIKGADAKVLIGSGTIKTGEKSGAVTITTDNVPDTLAELTIDMPASANTKAASMTIKIDVKTN